jgi:GrpB-like predicted nucleotidyltransferase (UPF0157 family)
MKQVTVEPYNSNWVAQFKELKNLIWPAVQDFAIAIEHVGSTSIPGLAAKPVIDIDIIIADMSQLPLIIKGLAAIGYEHRGNLGIEEREAFRTQTPLHKHNLYVCLQGSVALRNHLILRESLRDNPALRDEYAAVKTRLAAEYPDSIDNYVEGKTEFILKVLAENGLNSERLEEIRIANLAPAKK